MYKTFLTLGLLLTLMACKIGNNSNERAFQLDYEKFELENGLEVVLHVDRSDPVVSVVLAAHVGSAREKAGRTGFASRLTQELRVDKGYTYGIRSGFSGSLYKGPFRIATSVQSKITLEAALSIIEIVENYGASFTEDDLATTKGYLIKSNARGFESSWAKLNLLEITSAYGWSSDYIREREGIVEHMTVERIQELSQQYLDLDQMIWVVVGDAKTQKDRLKELGMGEVLLLN